MVDMVSISAFLSGLGVTIKFLQGSLEKIKDNAVREKVQELLNAIIPLQTMILSLQAENSAYIKEIQNLEEKLREIEDWKKESEGYELKEPAPGVRLYVKKSESGHAEPVMYFCPHCFDIHHKKSIIQFSSKGYYYTCLNCKNNFMF